jgi:hypothetical protein
MLIKRLVQPKHHATPRPQQNAEQQFVFYHWQHRPIRIVVSFHHTPSGLMEAACGVAAVRPEPGVSREHTKWEDIWVLVTQQREQGIVLLKEVRAEPLQLGRDCSVTALIVQWPCEGGGVARGQRTGVQMPVAGVSNTSEMAVSASAFRGHAADVSLMNQVCIQYRPLRNCCAPLLLPQTPALHSRADNLQLLARGDQLPGLRCQGHLRIEYQAAGKRHQHFTDGDICCGDHCTIWPQLDHWVHEGSTLYSPLQQQLSTIVSSSSSSSSNSHRAGASKKRVVKSTNSHALLRWDVVLGRHRTTVP